MSNSRRKFSPDFKAKVALEVLKEHSSLSAICSKYDLHPNLVSQWKKHLQSNLSKVFSDNQSSKDSDSERLIDSLYHKIGRLEVDNDWLKKKLL